MSNFDDFDSLLNTRASDIQRSINIPSGTWVWEVKAVKAAKAENGKDGYVLLTLSPVEPCDDVDLKEFHSWNEQDSDEVVFHRVAGTVRAVGAQLRSLMERVGMGENCTPASMYGERFLAHLKWDKNTRDESRPWSRLTNFSPLPKPRSNGEEQQRSGKEIVESINDDLPF